MSVYLRQGDDLWRKEKLGHGPKTIGQSGCLLAVYTEIARLFGLDETAPVTPKTMNAVALAQGAFVGSGLVQAKLAHALSLSLGDLVVDASAMRAALKTVGPDAVFICHVDHGGTRAADHFVLCTSVSLDKDIVECADPATGRLIPLRLSTLSGPAGWGGKTYSIRSVRRVSKVQSGT